MDKEYTEEVDYDGERKKPALKQSRKNLKQELDQLHNKHDALVVELNILKRKNNQVTSEWESRAINQAQAAKRALIENAQLKQVMEQQSKLAQTLKQAIEKQKLCDTPVLSNNQWRLAVLGTQDRELHLRKLLKYQYDKLESEWIRHNIYHYADPKSDQVTKAFIQNLQDSVRVNTIQSKSYPASVAEVGLILWDLITLKKPLLEEKMTSIEPLQVFGQCNDLVYSKLTAHISSLGVAIESRTAVQHFVEDNRIVFVWKSIVEDNLLPFSPNHLIDNKCGWVVLTSIEDGKGCRVTAYSHVTQPICPREQHLLGNTFTESALAAYQESSFAFDAAIMSSIQEKFLQDFHNIDDILAEYIDDYILDDILARNTFESASCGVKKKKRINLKRELDYLRQLEAQLRDQLDTLENFITPATSVWEQRAIEQAQAASYAKIENARLREVLDEQVKLVDSLGRLFRKVPKLIMTSLATPSDGWRHAKLSLTERALCAEKSHWIRNDLYTSQDKRRSWLESDGHGIVMHFTDSKPWPIDYKRLGDLYWMYVSNTIKVNYTVPVDMETLEVWPSNFVYTRYQSQDQDKKYPVYDGRTITKRYSESIRDVFIWSSILENETIPFNPHHARGTQNGWAVIESIGTKHSRFTVYLTITPPILPAPELGWPEYPIGALTDTILQLFHSNATMFQQSLEKMNGYSHNSSDVPKLTQAILA
ncbi:hypothetical protein THRCLA_06126 [Thraustotheca clavata]|uniref:START domain-containing protein n=1 Tax=Thraustotheca clavata TaxID=74557 RepID=A0A1V9ZQD9_9STRA|nr:hypothetical protein THRCLA_06126 [Thraustotheca clavata]